MGIMFFIDCPYVFLQLHPTIYALTAPSLLLAIIYPNLLINYILQVCPNGANMYICITCPITTSLVTPDRMGDGITTDSLEIISLLH